MRTPGNALLVWIVRSITLLLLISMAIMALAAAIGIPGLSVVQILNCSNEAAASPVARVPVAASPVPTPIPPTISDRIAACAGNINKNVFSPAQNLALFLAGFLVFLLTFTILLRLFQLSRLPSLVIDPFKNASGNTDIDKLLEGLNEQMREMLMVEIEDAKDGTLTSLQQGHLHTHIPVIQSPAVLTVDYSPPPVADIDQSFNQLSTAIRNLGAGSAQSILQFFTVLFSPGGTRISTTLQTDGGSPAKLGISIEIANLRHKGKPILHTIWEVLRPVPTSPIELGEPTEQDKDAYASYKLGLLYEGQNRLEEAQAAYTQALTKQPDYAPAIEGLKRVLAIIKTAEQRFVYLLQLVACWLAIELAYQSLTGSASFWANIWYQIHQYSVFTTRNELNRSEIVQNMIAPPSRIKLYQRIYRQIEAKTYNAVLQNFIGELYQSVYFSFPGYTFFYNQAIEAFKQAALEDAEWFLPPMCLADTYLLQATGVRGFLGALDTQTIYQALTHYEVAIESYNNYMYVHRRLRFITHAERQRAARIIRRLAIGQANVYLLTRDPARIQEAVDIIASLTGDSIFMELAPIISAMLTEQQNPDSVDGTMSEIMYLFRQMPKGIEDELQEWMLEKEADSSLLYILAAWFGLASNLLEKPCLSQEEELCQRYLEEQARLYLVYSLSLDDTLWNIACNDWRFLQTLTSDQFTLLRNEMLKETSRDPSWASQDDQYLRQSVQKILKIFALGESK